ncbi:MAG TPA: ATP-binding protein, partial [Streptosporangiaceae bacterium]
MAAAPVSQLQLIDDALQRCIDGIRRFCRALRPSVLDDLGLVPALHWLVTDLASRGGPTTRLDVSGAPVHLDPEQELAIFRIAQEALHNVERHAQANQVVVRFAYRAGHVCLEVADDGCGFDPCEVSGGRSGTNGNERKGAAGRGRPPGPEPAGFDERRAGGARWLSSG